MGWIDEQAEDALDWAKEQLGWAYSLVDGLIKPAFKQLIKNLRLKWQAHANEIINDIEDEAVEEVKKEFPTINEAEIRRIYWIAVNKVQDKLNIEWLQDT